MPLFSIEDGRMRKLASHPARDERSLQRLVETNLLEALGIHFLASEYQIGPGRRLDTLGIDENGSPTIIEYKRDRHHGVINQALSYLKWLRNQRREFFDRLVERALPDGTTGQVDWGNPRLVCVAESCSRNDIDSMEVIGMHLRLELVTYRLYDGGLIALEQIQVEHAPQPALKRQRDRGVLQSEGAQPEELSQKALEQQVRAPDDIRADAEVNSPEAGPAGIERLLERGSLAVRELFAELQAQIVGLGPGVVEHSTGAYIGYRVAQNFAEVHIQRSQIKLNLRPVDYDDPHGMVVKVPETHRWTLDRVVVLRRGEDLNYVMGLVQASYNDVL